MLFEKRSGSFLKIVNNRLTHHSRSGKHGRLGHVIGTREMSCGRSWRSIFIWFYLVFNNMCHGRKFKQMRLCSDFNAGPSRE